MTTGSGPAAPRAWTSRCEQSWTVSGPTPTGPVCTVDLHVDPRVRGARRGAGLTWPPAHQVVGVIGEHVFRGRLRAGIEAGCARVMSVVQDDVVDAPRTAVAGGHRRPRIRARGARRLLRTARHRRTGAFAAIRSAQSAISWKPVVPWDGGPLTRSPSTTSGGTDGRVRRQGRDRDGRGVGDRGGLRDIAGPARGAGAGGRRRSRTGPDGSPPPSGTPALRTSSTSPIRRRARRWWAAAVERFGRLDVAVNNAGIGGPQAPTGEYPLDGWAAVIAVNLSGVFHCLRAEIPAMLAGGGGAIVNMASILGPSASPGPSPTSRPSTAWWA